MKNTLRSGFVSYGVIIVIVAIIIGGAYYFLTDDKQSEVMKEDGRAMMEEKDGGTSMKVPAPGHEGVEEMIVKDEGAMMEKGETMMKDEDLSFEGELLAGTKGQTELLVFNKADYDKAVASNKLVVLYFYANWCPICKVEFPVAEEVFDSLDTSQVVGFRVNYNDSETDKDEENLAREFGVAYQHTKVFVKDGNRVLKSPETWDADRYEKEINAFLN